MTPDPELAIEFGPGVVSFNVSGPQTPFLGAVLLSLDPAVCYYFQGLPPLLFDHVVLALGVAQHKFKASIEEYRLPPGVPIYAQGVIADDQAIQSTPVMDFVVDASLPSDG